MAEALAESGADVCIWGRNEEKNQVAEQKLKSFGQRVLALKCDVSDKEQVEKCFARVLDEMGAVHACFAPRAPAQMGCSNRLRADCCLLCCRCQCLPHWGCSGYRWRVQLFLILLESLPMKGAKP